MSNQLCVFWRDPGINNKLVTTCMKECNNGDVLTKKSMHTTDHPHLTVWNERLKKIIHDLRPQPTSQKNNKWWI